MGLAQNAEVGSLKDLGKPDNILEPKLDGYRLLVHVTEDGVKSYTRTGKSQTGKLPLIEAELSSLAHDTWLDGELVAFTPNGYADWGAVQSVMGSSTQKAAQTSQHLVYVVFDILTYDGLDIRPLAFSQRRSALERVIPKGNPRVRVISQCEPTEESYRLLLAQGFEGGIIKSLKASYASGKRGYGQKKLKPVDYLDAVVTGYKPGENGFAGMVGAIEFSQVRNGKLEYRGRCSGMDMKLRQALTDNPDAYLGRVFSVAYGEIMPSGNIRFPRFKAWRDDKPATDCEWT